MSREHGGSFAAALTDAELDQLADFLAGVLEPRDEARVRRLVAEDARWLAARASLVAADAAVRSALAAEARDTAGPMPAHVAARIDDVVRDLAAEHPQSASPTESGARATAGSTVVSLAAARARRKRRATVITAVAAAVVVVAGVGVAASVLRGDVFATSGTSAMDNAGSAPQAERSSPLPSPGGVSYLVSATNYTVESLGAIGLRERANATFGATAGESDQTLKSGDAANPPPARASGQDLRGDVPITLERLTDGAAMAACLTAIRATTPGSPVRIEFARYAGEPALIVVLRNGSDFTAVAVGPDCGRSGDARKATAAVP